MKPSLSLGLWRLADPRLTLASLSSMALGTAAAALRGPIDARWLLLTVAGIVFIEVAKNASGEVADFDSGADQAVSPEDRSPFSGGRRVIVDGLLSRSQTAAISALTYAMGAGIGLLVAAAREPKVLWIGVGGTLLAWMYGAPPVKLAYRGLGEAAVTLCYGPLIVCGSYLVQRHGLAPGIVWLSLPLGLLIGAFLWINEFPDYRADRQASKRNLVVRLGRRRAAAAFAAIVGLAFCLQALLPLAGWPVGPSLAGLAGLPFGAAAVLRATHDPESTPRIIAAQRWTLLSFCLLAAGTAIGLALAR